MGEDFSHSEHINGFRFISPKNNQSFYRVEIWVDFADDNMELLKHFQQLLTELFKTLNFDSKSVRFLNNKTEQKEVRDQK
jgi:phosphoribosyl 1,2-cyclic phosphodiesterase